MIIKEICLNYVMIAFSLNYVMIAYSLCIWYDTNDGCRYICNGVEHVEITSINDENFSMISF